MKIKECKLKICEDGLMYVLSNCDPRKGSYLFDENGVFGPYEIGDKLIGEHSVIIATNDVSLKIAKIPNIIISLIRSGYKISSLFVEYKMETVQYLEWFQEAPYMCKSEYLVPNVNELNEITITEYVELVTVKNKFKI